MKLLDFRGPQYHPTDQSGVYLTRGSTVYGSTPIRDVITSKQTAAGATAGNRISASLRFDSSEFLLWLKMEDYLGRQLTPLNPGNALGARWMNRLEFRFTEPDIFTHYPEECSVAPGPMGVYSMRMYLRTPTTDPLPNMGQHTWFSFANGDPGGQGSVNDAINEALYAWSMRATGILFLDPGAGNRFYYVNNLNGSYASPPDSNSLTWPARLTSAAVRLEVQVDINRNPNTVVRIYFGPESTVAAGGSYGRAFNVANPTMDRLFIGDQEENSGTFHEPTYWGPIEVHDDYDLGGQFSATDPTTNPVSPAAANQYATGTPLLRANEARRSYRWWEFSKGTGVGGSDELLPLNQLGFWDGVTIDTDPARNTVNEMGYRDIHLVRGVDYEHYGWWIGDTANIVFNWNDNDGNSSAAHDCSLTLPLGTPPAGGWPVVFWAHSGFFISGSWRFLPSDFAKRCAHYGVAVVSLSYKLGLPIGQADGDAIIATGWTDGNYEQNAGYPVHSRYPYFITDYKNVVNSLRKKGMEPGIGNGTFPVDTTRMCFTGYSAGGYLAHGAACTIGMNDDGYGRDLTAAGSPVSHRIQVPGDGGAAPNDPVPLGHYSWSGPTNLKRAFNEDPTHPNHGLDGVGVEAMGIVRATARAFLGKTIEDNVVASELDGMSIAEHITRQYAQGYGPLPKGGYAGSAGDGLVMPWHGEELDDAYTAIGRGSDFYFYENFAPVHDYAMSQMNWSHFQTFMQEIGMRAGL